MKHLTKCFFYVKSEEELIDVIKAKSIDDNDTIIIAKIPNRPFEGFAFIVDRTLSVVTNNPRHSKEHLPDFIEKHGYFLKDLLKSKEVEVWGSDAVYNKVKQMLVKVK